jgi:hypothetical protein
MRMPDRCPACSGPLRVTSLACPDCLTRIEGSFRACPMCSLEGDDRELLELFLRVRGNAKEVERALGVSYPTVRARLDRLWSRLNSPLPGPAPGERPAMEILAELREGKIDAARAVQLLRHRGCPPAGSS